jgi:uncharacterized protein
MHKPSEFNILTQSLFPKWALAFNSLRGAFFPFEARETGTLVSILKEVGKSGQLPAEEKAAAWARKLVGHGFIVDAGLDERAVVRERYFEGRRQGHGLMLTIAPTINCNFGCSYCFQEHPARSMTPDDIARIRGFASRELKQGTTLSVTWFGGEPLMGFRTILELASYLGDLAKQRRCRFSQAIITNGYLLNARRVDQLAALGRFSYVQVTLDGPPRLHDRRRGLRDGRPTFGRILDNIAGAAAKLPVVVRVNVDRSNADGLEELVDLLAEAGLVGRIGVYLGHTLPYTDVCADVEERAFSRTEFAALEVRFKFLLLQRGWRRHFRLPTPGHGASCTADSPGGYVLAPGDLVFQCWNEVAMSSDRASGHLDEEQVTAAMRQRHDGWKGFDPFTHEPCRTCRVQPLCRGGCAWEARKNDATEPGHCTTLRFNIEDTLRLYHLQLVLEAGLKETAETGAGGLALAGRSATAGAEQPVH